jgi:hypothetical protein
LRGLGGDDAFLAVPTGSAIMALLAAERLADALAALEAMLDRAQRSGTLIAGAFAHHLRAEVRLRQGRLGAAIADSSAVLDISASGWDVCRGWIAPLLVRAYLARGDVDAARSALAGDWAKTSPNERSRLLHALADAIVANRKELAELEARNVGKAIASVKAELAQAVDNFKRLRSTLCDIAETDDRVELLLLDLCDNRVERDRVPVLVGDEGDAHVRSLRGL